MTYTSVIVECPDCSPATSGYNRVSIPGRFAAYERCSTCNDGTPRCTPGVIKVRVPVAEAADAAYQGAVTE